MKSIWCEFIDEYKEQIPYKSIRTILEAFYWYCEMINTIDVAYKGTCFDKTYDLMMIN